MNCHNINFKKIELYKNKTVIAKNKHVENNNTFISYNLGNPIMHFLKKALTS